MSTGIVDSTSCWPLRLKLTRDPVSPDVTAVVVNKCKCLAEGHDEMHVVEPALFIITGVVGGHASGIGHHDGRPKAAGRRTDKQC